ncbi:hypothetical protein I7I50_05869 [Histoplasma capsulatum G186AR]|uniref:Uncharacterized protein n=1 Tax=Ajellomyces capsulatus TaxID=5037 RepID=A0A8H7ZDB5_AJECA|nr:hypothetical protein I7I52_04128 [Histoplasma capsulatum]QSS76421.1 hypothetical protein I7I50_05869 [Histoplasma capsulatum G186AR]
MHGSAETVACSHYENKARYRNLSCIFMFAFSFISLSSWDEQCSLRIELLYGIRVIRKHDCSPFSVSSSLAPLPDLTITICNPRRSPAHNQHPHWQDWRCAGYGDVDAVKFATLWMLH